MDSRQAMCEAEWAELDRLRAENAMLRLAFCDEAYIVAVQTLDVKALGKGRRKILTNQAIRMFKVGLNEGLPRSTRETDSGLVRRAREKLAELSGAINEQRVRCPRCNISAPYEPGLPGGPALCEHPASEYEYPTPASRDSQQTERDPS